MMNKINKKIILTVFFGALLSNVIYAENAVLKAAQSTPLSIKAISAKPKTQNTNATDNLISPTTIVIDPNSQASITLSKTDINRLYVHGEKITSINFPGSLLSAHNDKSGGIYVNTHSNKPFTAFITTNFNLHFSILVIPKSIPGQTIQFIAPLPKIVFHHHRQIVIENNQRANHFENKAPYERTLINLIKTVELGKTPPGYTNIAPKAFSQISIFNLPDYLPNTGLKQTVVGGFLGGELAVRVLRIKNTTSQTMTLIENEFYQAGVRAVAIQHLNLNPSSRTYVFEVVSNV